jgi:hypothetical protein
MTSWRPASKGCSACSVALTWGAGLLLQPACVEQALAQHGHGAHQRAGHLAEAAQVHAEVLAGCGGQQQAPGVSRFAQRQQRALAAQQAVGGRGQHGGEAQPARRRQRLGPELKLRRDLLLGAQQGVARGQGTRHRRRARRPARTPNAGAVKGSAGGAAAGASRRVSGTPSGEARSMKPA